MATAAPAFTSSGLGLSSFAVTGAGLRVPTSRRAFLRIPAAARAPAPAPLRCVHNHADFVVPLSKVHVPAACDMMKLHVPAASDTMEVHGPTASDTIEVHGPTASGTMEVHGPTASDTMEVHGPTASDTIEVHGPTASDTMEVHVPAASDMVHVPAASDMVEVHAPTVSDIIEVHVPAASDMMQVHVPAAPDIIEVHVPAASDTMKVHGQAADDVNVHGPAAAALRDMIAGVFRPLLDNFYQLCSLWTVFDTEDYHIGMPYGALVASVACYQLWKMDPSTFMDAVLGYAFYKLSVVSSQVRKQGFSNDIIARIKFVLLVIWAVKDFHRAIPLECITYPVWFLYLTTFIYDMADLKKDARGIYLSWYQRLRN